MGQKLKMVDLGKITHASSDLECTVCGLTGNIRELTDKEKQDTRRFCSQCMDALIKERGQEGN